MNETRTVLTAIDELLHAAWARVRDELRVELQTRWEAVEAARTAEMTAAREEMLREIDLARRAFSEETAARQSWTDSEIDTLRAEQARAEQARAEAELALDVMRQRIDMPAGAALQPNALGDLVTATRELQEARSLGEVLEGLLRGARRFVARATLYIVRGDCLQEWNMTGLSDAADAPKRLWPAESPLWFEDDRGTFPIRVGGSVVAVLSVESASDDANEYPAWVDALDMLTRHVSLMLEALTLRRRARLDRRTDVYQPVDDPAPVGGPT